MLNPGKCQYVMEVIRGAATIIQKQCDQPIECDIDKYCHHHCLTHFDLRQHLIFQTPIIPEHLKRRYKKYRELIQGETDNGEAVQQRIQRYNVSSA